MKKIIIALLLFAVMFAVLTAFSVSAEPQSQPASVKIKVTARYLNIPVSEKLDAKLLTFTCKGFEDYSNRVKIAETDEDYWVYSDMARYKGKTIEISYEGSKDAIERLYLSDEIRDASSIYKEPLRPQQHFTYKRGWNNDPNGMVWFDGEYHLFGQHNPFEANWNNMHWGHAVSNDMVHWEELPIALYPDKLGAMFSGSAVIDHDNTAGFGKDAMVAFYTTAGESQVQCMAYSLDKGRSWTKYNGNPVIDSSPKCKYHQTRDPKVFWYPEGGHWVLVLYEDDGQSFYTSSNLKQWTWQSHVAGFYECPDFYRLPVDGDKDNVKWVLTAASGIYLVGDFDGKVFTPCTGLQRYAQGAIYAGQTFNNMPDGRVVQIAWLQSYFPGMPFKSSFSTPLEMSLRTTKDGIRLFAYPAKEFEVLQKSAFKGENMSVSQANDVLKTFNDEESLRIKASVTMGYTAGFASLLCNGQHLVNYEMGKSLMNGQFYSPAYSDKVSFSRRFLF